MINTKFLLLALLLILGSVDVFAHEEVGNVAQSVREVESDYDIEQASHVRRGGSSCAPPSSSSGSSTVAPTSTPTNAATTRPTSAPTTAPTTRPATAAPTTKPTAAPTTRPTAAATTRPTAAATTRPTAAATTKPTAAPTTRPATAAPTTKPTTAPTTKPTTAPTTKPSTSGSSSGSSVGLCDTTTEPLKLLVPLYTYPGASWDNVVAGASKVATIAIINPNSGPSASGPDSSYTTYMGKLKNANVEMVGYVYTSYGARAIADVKKDIDLYATKYPSVVGIFFDEASDATAQIAFYTEAYNYVISKGMKHSILNPGVQPAQGYVAISTSIVVFEDAGSKLSSISYASWVTCAATSAQKTGYKYKFAGIAHTTTSSSAASVLNTMKTKGFGLVYVTDGAAGCCTYNALVSYYSTQASSVQSLNA